MLISNLKYRLISAAFIALVFIAAIFFLRPLFTILMFLIAGLMLAEWYNITVSNKGYLYLGLVVIPMPIISMLYIAELDQQGWLLFSFFALIWCVDTVAMFVGKTLGGPKLAPVLSPGKTVSGLCGGILATSLLPLGLKLLPFYDISGYTGRISDVWLMTGFGFLALCAQLSDLFISFFKRKFGIKDSGSIIPGHGGVLDRFDSIIFTAPLVALWMANL